MSDDLGTLSPHSLGEKNFRTDLYKVVATIFSYPVPLQAVPGFEPTDQETKDLVAQRLGHILETFNLLANPESSTEVSDQYRPVVEQLINDLRELLRRMPEHGCTCGCPPAMAAQERETFPLIDMLLYGERIARPLWEGNSADEDRG